MKLRLLAFVMLLIPGLVKSQTGSFRRFVPVGFSILHSASGDLNGDGRADVVLILKNKYESMNGDTSRPLLILGGAGKGQYKLLARNDSVVLCASCGGLMGDPFEGVTIKAGYFSIEHMGGSGWRWTRIITFRYNKRSNQFILHRDAGYSWHVSEPEKQEKIVTHSEDFGMLSFEKFSYEKMWQ